LDTAEPQGQENIVAGDQDLSYEMKTGGAVEVAQLTGDQIL